MPSAGDTRVLAGSAVDMSFIISGRCVLPAKACIASFSEHAGCSSVCLTTRSDAFLVTPSW